MPESRRRSLATNKERMHELMKVALGEAEADLAIINGAIVNVYTGEVLTGDTVLIKGDRIAYVGQNAGKSIGASTKVIDATGKTLIPGLIEGHTHADYPFSMSELVRYAMKGGTTTIITEVGEFAFPLGYEGIIEFLRAARKQPIKIFITAPPMVSISPAAKGNALTTSEFRKLFRRKEFIGLGEPYWAPVVDGDERILDLMAETIRAGKRIEGHTAGAKDNKLQAYIASGITSCHEPITADEVLERLRLGLCILVREGEVRRELEAVSQLAKKDIDFRKLALCTDGLSPWDFVNDGYMEFVVQKAINLGFDPVVAIQMATINVAQHFCIDDSIGGIAPGKYADIVVIPDLKTIRPEYVISNGQIVARDGELLVQPRKHIYPKWVQNSVNLPRDFEASDFAIRVDSNRSQVKVRVMDVVTDIVSREALIDMPVSNGQLQPDTDKDILKVAAIDRTNMPGKTFVGLIRGMGLKRGAIALTPVWDTSDIIVVGANDADMARAINRIRELNGGIVIYDDGKILAEIALPVAGWISTEPMETIAEKLYDIQRVANSLGVPLSNVRLSLYVLTTAAIPFLRITEHGLVDIRQNKLVSLIVD